MTGKNAELGLPYTENGMQKLIHAFDVDGTLIDENGEVQLTHARWHDTLKALSTAKNVKIVIWSGGGKKYAEMVGRRFGLDKYVWRYASKTEWPEIRKLGHVTAYDDIQDTAIGDINIIVRNK